LFADALDGNGDIIFFHVGDDHEKLFSSKTTTSAELRVLDLRTSAKVLSTTSRSRSVSVVDVLETVQIGHDYPDAGNRGVQMRSGEGSPRDQSHSG